MSQPAEVTTAHDWDRLNALLAALVFDIEELWDQITDSNQDSSEQEEAVPTDDADIDYDFDREAWLDEERHRPLDLEAGGGHDPALADAPELDG
ncbi:hypothetical protein JIG36_48590 [Actinoplanes sp. LDG1-06]|uniref:Uncharacterized protein n=1 Tax=Paractinoplanes ovalisporus TaxID=2810368 RepID=A0ABS2AUG2_9ACTN|nr:hypothetical protein [Actinoplanes ovalisporus]MBM2623380.1 hypothetical protein [Actinoplanes ovalisporus]